MVRFVRNSKNLLFFEVIVQSFQQMAHSWQKRKKEIRSESVLFFFYLRCDDEEKEENP